MSERLHNHSENQENKAENPYGSHERPKVVHETHEHKAHNQAEHLKNISEKVEKIAKKTEELQHTHDQKDKTHAHTSTAHHNSEYGSYTASQAIKRVQKHLKPSERRFSKVIHNQKVEIVSDIAGGTVARPSGLLYGGVFSLLSSVVLYFISKHYGYEYSFFVGILFFVGGFVLGLLIESVVKIFKKQPSN